MSESPPRLWTTQQVATYLAVPVATLYRWRHEQSGPRGLKVGRHVRYRQADVESWVTEQVNAEPRRRAV